MSTVEEQLRKAVAENKVRGSRTPFPLDALEAFKETHFCGPSLFLL
jgi:hypothetical protein